MQRHPHLKERPVLVVDYGQPSPVVADYFPAATEAATGMTLEQARSRQPGAMALAADEPFYRRQFRQVLASLQGIGGPVEDAGLGTAYAALDGLEPLYGSEELLAIALLNAVPEHLRPQAGIGAGKFPALAAARTSDPLRAARAPEDAAAFLSSRPVALLPVAEGTVAALLRSGAHTLGQVAGMELRHLKERFGPEGELAWNLAHGRDLRPLTPLEREEAALEQLAPPASLPYSAALPAA